MEVFFSIISPTYNHGEFIEDCIQSVINQNYKNWELIIIDDGSTDNTFTIVDRYCKKDSRIKYFRQDNVGIFNLSTTYNNALSYSNGNYISILEGDDYWPLDKLSIQAEEILKNPKSILFWGNASSVTSKSKQEIRSSSFDNNEIQYLDNKPVGTLLNILFIYNCIPALTITIRKKELNQIGGFKQGYNLPLVDLPTILALVFLGEFKYTNHLLGYWRHYSNQVTKSYNIEMNEGFYELRKIFFEENYCQIKNLGINVTMETLILNHKKNMIISYSRMGRYELIKKNFSKARSYYLKSIFKFGLHEPIWKLRSLVGCFFSFFSFDIEVLAELFGKGRIDR